MHYSNYRQKPVGVNLSIFTKLCTAPALFVPVLVLSPLISAPALTFCEQLGHHCISHIGHHTSRTVEPPVTDMPSVYIHIRI